MKTKTIRLGETVSTNDYLLRFDGAEDEEMVVATAEYQTAGRGQGTNTWESERGKNLLFSLLVRPTGVPARRQFALSMAGALAIKKALDSYTEGITLKWPNDVYWHDSKISGTLIETSLEGGCIRKCVFGTGINVNQRVFVSDAPNPTSLSLILGHDVEREEVLQKVTDAFASFYDMVVGGRYDDVAGMYCKALYRRTGIHPYADADGRFEASVSGVGGDGRLFLTDTDGRKRSYAFKEVSFII